MLGILNMENTWIKLFTVRSGRLIPAETAADTKRIGRFKKKVFEPGW
jgi:hypothetical protein